MTIYHNSVLSKEAAEHLKIIKGARFIDATLGDGGHTIEILRRGGNVLGIDRDPIAIKRTTERLEALESDFLGKYLLIEGNFSEIDKIASGCGFEAVKGILYDLGTSYYQLSDSSRGFSFNADADLDMRMGGGDIKASDLVNALSEKELTNLIGNFGGERFAGRIARAIVKARKEEKVATTLQLVKIIEQSVPKIKGERLHVATRTFQALRIAVNDELENLKKSLSRAASLLAPGGRLVIISFHSLEDKIAKGMRLKLQEVYEKPLAPSVEEQKLNIRSRSAKMRVFEKI